LMDFYKANPVSENDYYKSIIFNLSQKVLEDQNKDMTEPLACGQWKGAFSTSGTGWINEVTVETYRFCKEQKETDCEKYKDASIRAIRWLIQNTYSKENTFSLKNPERAIGGVFWNQENKYVRTDSVCHALNGYALVINDLKDGLLLFLPEKTLE